MTEYDSISRDDLASPPLRVCDNCGCELSLDDETIYEAKWSRYEASNDAAGTGWVTYCEDCAPPGML